MAPTVRASRRDAKIVASFCYVAAIALGLPWGLMGVAIAYTAMALILWPISHSLANRLIDLRTIDLFGALVAPAVLAAGLAASLAALKLIWGPVEPAAQVMFLAACAAAGLTVLAAAAFSGRPAAAGEAMALAREAIARMRPTRQTRIGG